MEDAVRGRCCSSGLEVVACGRVRNALPFENRMLNCSEVPLASDGVSE